MPPVRIDQKAGSFRVHRQREVVRHGLVHSKARGPPKGCGKVSAFVGVGQVDMPVHGVLLESASPGIVHQGLQFSEK
jgi:hypothetical protein